MAGAERALHVAGMEDCPNFRGPILDETDTLDSAAEITAAARKLCAPTPSIGAILLECWNMPPYAHAVQAATGRPVFDVMTMSDQVRAATRRTPYRGRC